MLLGEGDDVLKFTLVGSFSNACGFCDAFDNVRVHDHLFQLTLSQVTSRLEALLLIVLRAVPFDNQSIADAKFPLDLGRHVLHNYVPVRHDAYLGS